MKQTKIMIGTIWDPVADPAAAIFEFEDHEDLQGGILEFEGKRVRITIEEL